ncbi:MAG: DUF2971 domain-containing protein [Proteobacteria bacterium]|nr:DUF2971 domain-containing protein [Pseudomonadota bacterium]
MTEEKGTPAPNLPHPPPETKIWRYLDLPRFLSFLNSKSVTFAKPTTFEDPYEGAATKHGQLVRKIMFDVMIPEDEKEGARGKLASEVKRMVEARYISCWHMNEHESDAMWRLYGSEKGAVALQTTFGKLYSALSLFGGKPQNPQSLLAGAVQYIDYETSTHVWNEMISPFFYKRKSFEHEKEVRFFISFIGTPPDPVVSLPISDAEAVFEKIYISPLVRKWVAVAITETYSKYGYKIPLEHSALYQTPPFMAP